MQFDQDIDHLTKSGQDFSAKVQMIHGSALPKVWLKVLLKALVKVLVKALVKQMWIPIGQKFLLLIFGTLFCENCQFFDNFEQMLFLI